MFNISFRLCVGLYTTRITNNNSNCIHQALSCEDSTLSARWRRTDESSANCRLFATGQFPKRLTSVYNSLL